MPETRPETLRPLPLRITQRTYLRLQAHRQIDQLAIQEHVRRALDAYLDMLDRKRPLERVAAPLQHVETTPEPDAASPPESAASDDQAPVKQPAAAPPPQGKPVPRPRAKKANSKPQLAYR